MRSVHEGHRLALTELAAGSHLPVVEHAARGMGIEVEHSPVTMRGALRRGSGPFAEMVVALGHRAQDAVSVECWVSRPDGVVAPYLTRAGAVGWVRVAPITDDPVAATAARLDGLESRLVRYHPGRRATVRVTGPAHVPACPVAYAKVFSDHRGAARYDLSKRLAAAAEGGIGLRVPRPAAYDADRFVIWHHEVAGVLATDLLTGPTAPALAVRIGAALGSLHTSGLEPSQSLTAAGLLLRTERYAADVCRLVPALGERVLRLLETVCAGSSRGHDAVVPVHGSPDPGQWLVGVDPVPGLLDFDRFAWGAPEHDVACFLVEVEALADSPEAAVAVNDGFLVGYESVAGPVDPETLRRHCTMRRMGKVVRAARALRVDGDHRAGRVLAAAERAAAARDTIAPSVAGR